MHRLSWKKQAQADLISIVRHIAKDNPDAAEKLAGKIEKQTELLRENPLLFRIGRKRGTRELVAHENHIVIYRVLPAKIEILRVKHVAQQWP